ncbi:Metalloendopeptidase OMA1, mitochondrial [Wickerhamomyces ciferrii]|uniref:Metalloendopeptidase OMA1, mitochondrial n=1 Tax=Wickerhamomyces ciferrii (strain ATCC 14091 / BCRC 22168 / CBS 111 / JCM 3599 / NBRC 0793 / NRRL Y-1031 F-60-10) TaxID=1206466 RepID=K0KNN3_WICCF|nr:Metalloendopeptidase OMA1, mitochondrial [Wickerhamomyces ciferrii]CCH43009.1 Metalloendopeptidase OMA1, mitochondrial [Wickerhamomyces ciferrii]
MFKFTSIWLRGAKEFGSQASRTSKASMRWASTYKRFNNTKSSSNILQDPTYRKYAAGVLGLGGVFYVTHLEEAPVTGRRRFIWSTEGLEKWVGDRSYRQVLAENRGHILPPHHPLSVKVSNVFEKILKVSPIDESHLDWKVHIVNDPRAPPNAFVLPGGKVFVFSSILNICQNDDGLATVLSHEFAHQLARHTGENLSKTPIYAALGIFLYALTGADFFNSLLINTIIKMPASRAMETEADYIGLMLMSEACYDPNESYKLWERMANWEKGRGVHQPEFMSTHPGTETRIQNMRSWLPEAEERRAKSHCGQFTSFYDFGRGREIF